MSRARQQHATPPSTLQPLCMLFYAMQQVPRPGTESSQTQAKNSPACEASQSYSKKAQGRNRHQELGFKAKRSRILSEGRSLTLPRCGYYGPPRGRPKNPVCATTAQPERGGQIAKQSGPRKEAGPLHGAKHLQPCKCHMWVLLLYKLLWNTHA